MKLVIAGGGTGGHLFPGISVAEEFLSRDASNEVLFVGTQKGIESRVVPQSGYHLETITASGVRGKNGFAKIKGIAQFMFGYSQSRQILKKFQPDLVLGVGGYASAPLCLAARGMLISSFIHEQNAIPGMTNRILARVAGRVFISLEESGEFFPASKICLTGNPIRLAILKQADEPGSPDNGKTNLLIFGGSQGARSINSALIEALPHLEALKESLSIVHQTGVTSQAEVKAAYDKSGFQSRVVEFIDDMASAYGSSDIIVCRAGATTIAEVTACGKCCIFIPFPHAVDDHQRKNAEALLKRDACVMLLEQELSGERLAGEILRLIADPARINAIADNARAMAKVDAARIIVDEMIKTKGAAHVR